MNFAAILLTLLMLPGCGGPACVNEVLSGWPSPDGTLIAFIYHRRCGAAAEVSTHVSVISYHESLHNETGNVLAASGEQPVKVSWRGPKELAISGFKNPLYQRAEPIHSVAVEYP